MENDLHSKLNIKILFEFHRLRYIWQAWRLDRDSCILSRSVWAKLDFTLKLIYSQWNWATHNVATLCSQLFKPLLWLSCVTVLAISCDFTNILVLKPLKAMHYEYKNISLLYKIRTKYWLLKYTNQQSNTAKISIVYDRYTIDIFDSPQFIGISQAKGQKFRFTPEVGSNEVHLDFSGIHIYEEIFRAY